MTRPCTRCVRRDALYIALTLCGKREYVCHACVYDSDIELDAIDDLSDLSEDNANEDCTLP